MNFVQKNPNDPKYQEFHDGEYEYWPTDSAIKTKSISIPAAVVSGLELIAAAAAAGLLAVAMAVLYVTSSPLAIHYNSAEINTNVYNNTDNQSIVYTLTAEADPDRILQEGTLQDDKETLILENLASGTSYLLKFYDAEQNEVGEGKFTTLGQPQEPVTPDPGAPEEPAGNPEPTDDTAETEAATEPEETTEPESTEEPTEEPTEEEEEEPVVPSPYPGPAPTPDPEPDPEPEPDPDPEPDPEPEPEPDPEPEPTMPPMQAFSPEVEEIVYTDPYDPEDSGNTDDAYFEITEVYIFINIPADHSVTVLQNGQQLENILSYYSEDGTLTVTVYGNPVRYGETVRTSVKVDAGGNSIEQGSTITPPYLMKEATLDMVEETADDSTTYTFTITAHTRDGSNEKMVCEAELHTMGGDDYVLVPLFEVSPGMYVGTYRVTTTAWPEESPFAIIKGYWDKTPEGTYYQEAFALYNPA